ncbi:transcription factor iiib 90 kda subunit [Plakobranchus ocellatus]|uniref:Transcription factor iiib 90 kDa subunit n=1 Tax=Plakobranchus ocellatus TaxID=259542 RepID=A0AAV4DN36_9GAST|nr:transcription factor iiib 90 kda subunit [Plakobranchus ocellatus]
MGRQKTPIAFHFRGREMRGKTRWSPSGSDLAFKHQECKNPRPTNQNSAIAECLPLLAVGDCVRIQNQTGPHPTKWDKTGIVIQVHQFDQYVIRVDGTGKITLRNRKFLHLYHSVIARSPMATLPSFTAIITKTTSGVLTKPMASAPATYPEPVNTPEMEQPRTPPDNNSEPPSDSFISDPVVEPEPINIPNTPATAADKSPPIKTTCMPNALRAQQPHNKPGGKEDEIEEVNSNKRRKKKEEVCDEEEEKVKPEEEKGGEVKVRGYVKEEEEEEKKKKEEEEEEEKIIED